MAKARLISVIGAGSEAAGADEAACETARQVGRLLAEKGWGVVCGGLKGIMRAVCQGASEAGGLTVGIIPSTDAADANPYCKVVVPTGMGQARNLLVVLSGKGAIAITGKGGTLSEIGHALKEGKPVVSLMSWDFPGVTRAADAEDAVEKILAAVEK
ncbi:hypothetical protein X474_02270 [Dethiosulfatarculus sandiegensis]|uniref:TIGR00725 family protein n=1 Tax=Dethiosulfatarculus sandiegensis TaxID=1429043 RepID=A0A0D2JIR6_9BACT|nr:hypothetical protein X474_02270 [Dethiosulfatarculus sandiegensis]